MSKKRIIGNVVSDKMQKTVVVSIDVPTKHHLYDKKIKNTSRVKARDGVGVSVGDKVVLEESRPFSKEVTWKVIEKLER